jgi:hypothetical protein
MRFLVLVVMSCGCVICAVGREGVFFSIAGSGVRLVYELAANSEVGTWEIRTTAGFFRC